MMQLLPGQQAAQNSDAWGKGNKQGQLFDRLSQFIVWNFSPQCQEGELKQSLVICLS